MVTVKTVIPGSPCDKHGVISGDVLVSVNGNEIRDVLDYRFYICERKVELLFSRDGEDRFVKLRKDEYDDIGLEFETYLMDKKQSCRNKCIFCFIDQLPKGMRETLYFKDDDSRLSFLHGNYVTLTNMTESDIDRIIKMRLTPVNVSVHTTDPELRVKMMKNRFAGESLRFMKKLKDGGITMNCQIVLCRNVNDGENLMRTMRDLESFYPSVTSVSVVPAGLTRFRDGLYPLSPYTKEESGKIIDMVEGFADGCEKRRGDRIFYLADELYIEAGRDIPPSEKYGEFSQIENGVGLMASMLDEFRGELEYRKDEIKAADIKKRLIITGVAAEKFMKDRVRDIKRIAPSADIEVRAIINNFFGGSVTVSGLVTGKDVIDQLGRRYEGYTVLATQNMLRSGEDVFLCDTRVSEVEEATGTNFVFVRDDGAELLAAICGLE
ncbi:MAG: DUF512 domain-containing protein [Clostridia bacterium]|nr:DUF512 domain-containing protein [Clostridia bacterium]